MKIQSANGSVLVLENGQSVVDAGSGAVCANLGYGHPIILSNISEAFGRYSYVHTDYECEHRERLFEQLSDWLPDRLLPYHFTCTGSEAVEAAVRLASAYQAIQGRPQRRRILALSISFHGAGLVAQELGGANNHIGPITLNTIDVVRLPQSVEFSSDCVSVEQVLEVCDFDDVAAILVEPINGTSGGAFSLSPGLLSALRTISHRFDIPLIFDEVLTGFYRCGSAFIGADLEPDLIISGKGLAAGYGAICGVFVTEAFADVLKGRAGNLLMSTNALQPAACAAASAVQCLLQSEIVPSLHTRSTMLHNGLSIAAQKGNARDLRGCGMYWVVEFNPPKGVSPAHYRKKLYESAMSKGVRFYEAGRQSNTCSLVIAPPLNISDEHIALVCQVLAGIAHD